MASKAWTTFTENIKDLIDLHNLHRKIQKIDPASSAEMEVLNRAGIVLTTSFWEAFCEDIAAEALDKIIESAKDATVLPNEIKKQIAKELKDNRNELAIWDIAGDNWRKVLRARLTALQEARNRKLNTPKTQNIDDLFESAVGVANISSGWTLTSGASMTPEEARKKLDKMVTLRGEIAHRGKAETLITKADVKDYSMFVAEIAVHVDADLSRHVLSVCGVAPW